MGWESILSLSSALDWLCFFQCMTITTSQICWAVLHLCVHNWWKVQNKLKSFSALFSKAQSDFVFFGLDLFILYLCCNTMKRFIREYSTVLTLWKCFYLSNLSNWWLMESFWKLMLWGFGEFNVFSVHRKILWVSAEWTLYLLDFW